MQPLKAPPIPPRDYVQPLTQHQLSNNLITPTNYKDSNDLFQSPISIAPPVSCIQSNSSHPVKLPQFYDQPGPIETNNFYGNLLVDSQNLPIWTHPYSIWKSTDDKFKGLGISHTSASQRVYGEDPNSDPVKYFFNPVGICSMMLSADEFQLQNFNFLVGDLQRFSIGMKFVVNSGELHVNAVQGMGFISGIYNGNITPRIASKVGFHSFQQLGYTSNGMKKYVTNLFDNTKWIIYTNATFTQQSANSILAETFGGQILVQIAKLNNDYSIQYYDEVAGAYVLGCTLAGTVNHTVGTYSFNYQIGGTSNSNKVLQWFLPHHVESMDQQMKNELANDVNLDSTCKGSMQAFITQKFIMTEKLPPIELQFDPWSDINGVNGYSEASKLIIHQIAQDEVNSFDVVNESNTDSMYTAGKILDKGAFMLYVVALVLKDVSLTKILLSKMKLAFKRFLENKQQAPLCYDTNWKGIISTAGLSDGNFYCDFGNCFYNDHHFHYGYHIHAAALVALVDREYDDGSWLNVARPWIDTLIRDIFNPTAKDPYFPVFRAFDFFNGHSFANGLFAHGDGKDEESSSEDYHAYYGIKLWGIVNNNPDLVNLASLILSIEKHAMGLYMLYKNENKIMPPNFIRNKVSGILFENKIDHATYFGMNKEYIHGIHMIPITPLSNYIRDSKFVKEEWNEMSLGQLASSIDGGWKGLLMLNSAMHDPRQAWEFFSNPGFQMSWLDNGMSRTWSLAYCAGIGGC
jgi:endo-1,3(4)-beta-glucanase